MKFYMRHAIALAISILSAYQVHASQFNSNNYGVEDPDARAVAAVAVQPVLGRKAVFASLLASMQADEKKEYAALFQNIIGAITTNKEDRTLVFDSLLNRKPNLTQLRNWSIGILSRSEPIEKLRYILGAATDSVGLSFDSHGLPFREIEVRQQRNGLFDILHRDTRVLIFSKLDLLSCGRVAQTCTLLRRDVAFLTKIIQKNSAKDDNWTPANLKVWLANPSFLYNAWRIFANRWAQPRSVINDVLFGLLKPNNCVPSHLHGCLQELGRDPRFCLLLLHNWRNLCPARDVRMISMFADIFPLVKYLDDGTSVYLYSKNHFTLSLWAMLEEFHLGFLKFTYAYFKKQYSGVNTFQYILDQYSYASYDEFLLKSPYEANQWRLRQANPFGFVEESCLDIRARPQYYHDLMLAVKFLHMSGVHGDLLTQIKDCFKGFIGGRQIMSKDVVRYDIDHPETPLWVCFTDDSYLVQLYARLLCDNLYIRDIPCQRAADLLTYMEFMNMGDDDIRARLRSVSPDKK